MKKKIIKLCSCACGGLVRKDKQFLWGHNAKVTGFKKGNTYGGFKKGQNNPNYNYGLTKAKHDNKWYIIGRDLSLTAFARAVMEAFLQRSLSQREVIHHIDKNSLNDSLYNLKLFSNQGEHFAYHWKNESKERKKERAKEVSIRMKNWWIEKREKQKNDRRRDLM